MYVSLNTNDTLVSRLKFITFIYVIETQRDISAKNYEVWGIQFYLVVTKNLSNNGRYKTPKDSSLKYRLIVNGLVTLIKQFFFNIFHQLRLIVSSVSRQTVFHIVISTSVFSKFVLFTWGSPTKYAQEFIVSSIAPIQNKICGTVNKSFTYEDSSPLRF